MQKVVGKVGYLANICSNIKSAMAIINIEKARFEKQFPEENEKQEAQQVKISFLSLRCRRDLRFIRSVLASIQKHPIPLESYSRQPKLTAGILVYGDASGKTDDLEDPAALGIYIPQQHRISALALSYILPIFWLLAKDGVSVNKDNTVLLEILSLLTLLVEFPFLFQNQSVIFVTDSMAFSQLYKKLWAKSESTAYVLRTLNFITQSLNISLDVVWRRRRSNKFTRIADDLTHSNFKNIHSSVKSRRVSTLPEPILDSLLSSCNMVHHTYGNMVENIKKFWNRNNFQYNGCSFY